MISANEFRGLEMTSGQLNLIFRSREIWRDLGTWISTYIISIYAGFGSQEAVLQKLNRIPIEFGNILRLIFGEQDAEKYTSFLSDFIRLLVSFVTAQINGDSTTVNEVTMKLYQNADQIAVFLSQINPYWQESEWKNLLYQFIGITIEESTTLLNKEYINNIDAYDKMLAQTSILGDYYSQGLLNYLNYSNRQVRLTS